MVDLRKRREAEKFKDKQEKRQKMIDKQIENLNTIKNKDDEILSHQIKDAEEKKMKELEEKKKRLDELKVNNSFKNFFKLLASYCRP